MLDATLPRLPARRPCPVAGCRGVLCLRATRDRWLYVCDRCARQDDATPPEPLVLDAVEIKPAPTYCPGVRNPRDNVALELTHAGLLPAG